jgi:hypothetical protein
MRELKFRVWDNEQIKFEYFEPHNITVPDRLLTQHKFPVQQFTELYDKNKKPIYEGDRVKFGYTGNHDFYGEVIWLNDRASFGVKTGNAFETFEGLMDYMEFFEVVGNIFENRESLNNE